MRFIKLILVSLLFYSCGGSIGAGSLGGWDRIVFKIPETKLKKAIDSLYKVEPKYYHIKRWKSEAKYWVKNFSYLRTVIFYFDEPPTEMYYVTFIPAGTGDNPNYSTLAVRGVENGDGKWKEFGEFDVADQERIQNRFKKEIISRLEQITKTKSEEKKTYR